MGTSNIEQGINFHLFAMQPVMFECPLIINLVPDLLIMLLNIQYRHPQLSDTGAPYNTI